MLELSFDSETNSLYWYFTELLSDTDRGLGECHSTLLLDTDGMLIGVELELDESISRDDLRLALAHPEVQYDPAQMLLSINLFNEAAADVQPLDEPAVLDFDAADSLLGCEIFAAESFGLATRLQRLQHLLIDPDAPEPEVAPESAASAIPEPAGDAAPLDLTHTEPDLIETDRTPPAAPPATLPPDQANETATLHSGFVAIVGRPNVGKSTLMNALLGQKVAIVSPRPQTTRTLVRGILTRPDAQIIFVDTPGIHRARTRLGNYMVESARRAIPDADVICFLVDISRPPGELDERIAAMLGKARAPRLLVLNKIDIPVEQGETHLEAYRALGEWDMEIAISARDRIGLDALLDEIVKRLPRGTRMYPEDQISDQSEREHAAELVREKVLLFTDEEVPHAVAVETEEWEQREKAIYIRMTIYVEKDSQKQILIGAQGSMLKRIGSAARRDIEAMVGQHIFLELWVKTRANWRDDSSALHWLGYKNS